jgi:hypothetical protein
MSPFLILLRSSCQCNTGRALSTFLSLSLFSLFAQHVKYLSFCQLTWMICSTFFSFHCHTNSYIFLFSTNTFLIQFAHSQKIWHMFTFYRRKIPKTQLCIGQKLRAENYANIVEAAKNVFFRQPHIAF